jgi:L-threonylcarbamoyladenylate synthase
VPAGGPENKVPRTIIVNGREPDAGFVKRAGEILRQGGIVAHPTETLYGLAADPWNAGALDRLTALKGRPAGSGYILLTSSAEEALALGAGPALETFRRLAWAFWPGPLTLVVEASEAAPPGATGPGGGIAVRESPDPVARALVRALGRPITSTSANRTGGDPARSGAEVSRIFGDGVDLILDAGGREATMPSTLVDLRAGTPVILRRGAISPERLREVLDLHGSAG